jgi:hypothetical protein
MMRALIALAALSATAACSGSAPAPVDGAEPEAAAAISDPRDLQGLWVISNRSLRGFRDEAMQPLQDYLTPAAAKTRAAANVALDPSARCMTMFPRQMGWPYPLKIVQTKAVTLILFEADQVFRQIHTDGSSHPDADEQRWLGHSIGHWEGDTLVVDTTNFNPNAWLEADGTPMTENTHITERIRLVDGKTLEDVMMIEDPAVFTRPVYRKYVYNLRDDWDLLEYFCAEGNRDNVQDQKEGQPGSLKLNPPPAAQ